MINVLAVLGTMWEMGEIWESGATGAQMNRNYSYGMWKEGKG